MKTIDQDKKVTVEAYKHNEVLYRTWKFGEIIELNENHLIVFEPINTDVIEKFGKHWKLIKPSITFFYKNKWHNKVFMLNEDSSISIYINIAAPYKTKNNTITYVDYDFDFKVDPDGNYKLVDMTDFHRNRKKYKYSPEITNKILEEIVNVKEEIDNNFSALIKSAMKYFK